MYWSTRTTSVQIKYLSIFGSAESKRERKRKKCETKEREKVEKAERPKKEKSSKEETFSPDSHRAVSHRLELVAREQAPDQVEGVAL